MSKINSHFDSNLEFVQDISSEAAEQITGGLEFEEPSGLVNKKANLPSKFPGGAFVELPKGRAIAIPFGILRNRTPIEPMVED